MFKKCVYNSHEVLLIKCELKQTKIQSQISQNRKGTT